MAACGLDSWTPPIDRLAREFESSAPAHAVQALEQLLSSPVRPIGSGGFVGLMTLDQLLLRVRDVVDRLLLRGIR